MIDPRIIKLANILVNYSVSVKKGDILVINSSSDSAPLALECYKLALKNRAYPVVNFSMPGFGYTYYKYASLQQLKRFPKIAEFEAKQLTCEININAPQNTREFSNVDPKKIALRRKITRPISEIILKKRWVGCVYPTNAMAQEADMSLEEFENFLFNATNRNWKEESKKQDKLKKVLDKGSRVRIVADDTDISFSIKGREALKCDGKHNMPDGEVFIAPVETTTDGFIKYTYPTIYGGREVDGVTLEFKNGAVVKAKAGKNEGFLKAMLKTDKGAKYLGEFGVGVNYNINKFIKSILFDEKIGGTIHLALGMAYKRGGGKNESALHWDMIKDLKQGGTIYVDHKIIQKNGKFRL
ncbi:aminopeptidase [Candidatus Woesearchaeota archaeon]|nr:aminopeptidase [Candidatus Woesearchaeota archaeon]